MSLVCCFPCFQWLILTFPNFVTVHACFLQSNQIWHNIHLWQFACAWKVCTLFPESDSPWSYDFVVMMFLIGFWSFESCFYVLNQCWDFIRVGAASIFWWWLIYCLFVKFCIRFFLVSTPLRFFQGQHILSFLESVSFFLFIHDCGSFTF